MNAETRINTIINYAKSELRSCPYCIQHDDDFKKSAPNAGKEIFAFSSSPAFLYNHRWYHLQLCNPQENSKGGYNWVDCQGAIHNDYLVMATGKQYTLGAAADYARDVIQEATQ